MPESLPAVAPRRTRIKVCGLTRAADVAAACALGVDAVGFVFAARSRRRLDAAAAAALRDGLQPFVAAVALFMDNEPSQVRAIIATVRPTILQFHGGEDDAFCAGFGLPYLKAVAMGGDAGDARGAGAIDRDGAGLLRRFPGAAGLLFDANASGQAGGTGHAFDWARYPTQLARPGLLAGGLHPGNVFEAIRATACWGVDVSSGIEAFADGKADGGNAALGEAATGATLPGVKDAARMRRFVAEVRRADTWMAARDSASG